MLTQIWKVVGWNYENFFLCNVMVILQVGSIKKKKWFQRVQELTGFGNWNTTSLPSSVLGWGVLTQLSARLPDTACVLTCSYSTVFETSNQPVTDAFHFTVFDADNNRLDRQMFTITITSAQTAPSLIVFADHIAVSGYPRYWKQW